MNGAKQDSSSLRSTSVRSDNLSGITGIVGGRLVSAPLSI